MDALQPEIDLLTFRTHQSVFASAASNGPIHPLLPSSKQQWRNHLLLVKVLPYSPSASKSCLGNVCTDYLLYVRLFIWYLLPITDLGRRNDSLVMPSYVLNPKILAQHLQ